ncbi:MAG: hypothetical protein QM784_02505 [Polyangiaceae bacterium]
MVTRTYDGRQCAAAETDARLHKYITKNSEYLFTGDVCLEVRKRERGEVVDGHRAVRQRIVASVRWLRDGTHQVMRGKAPSVGESLLLGEAGDPLLTSVVRRIETEHP